MALRIDSGFIDDITNVARVGLRVGASPIGANIRIVELLHSLHL
jgi:hypothetical protein